MRAAAIALALAALAACGGRQQQGVAYDPRALPAGALGDEIRYGRDIVMETRRIVPQDVRARMDCAACHIDGGTRSRAGSFVGTYAAFPQWNARAHRVIALQDRLAECFLYSMNGRPPAYSSREMVALVAYIAWLSRGTPTQQVAARAQSFVVALPRGAPNPGRGATLYLQRCAACHGANGSGNGAFPALWGEGSFNRGAGMAHVNRMTGFVYYNMPQNAPGTLTKQDAYDVAAFVLSHARPGFRKDAAVGFPALPASYF